MGTFLKKLPKHYKEKPGKVKQRVIIVIKEMLTRRTIFTTKMERKNEITKNFVRV